MSIASVGVIATFAAADAISVCAPLCFDDLLASKCSICSLQLRRQSCTISTTMATLRHALQQLLTVSTA